MKRSDFYLALAFIVSTPYLGFSVAAVTWASCMVAFLVEFRRGQ